MCSVGTAVATKRCQTGVRHGNLSDISFNSHKSREAESGIELPIQLWVQLVCHMLRPIISLLKLFRPSKNYAFALTKYHEY